jgi:hypothetical protein
VTIGYLSKNAAPLSFSIAWSEIRTPNHPDGISTDVGDCGGCGALCAIDSPGSANDAIIAAAICPFLIADTSFPPSFI